jgi:hypothetical protein
MMAVCSTHAIKHIASETAYLRYIEKGLITKPNILISVYGR